MKCPFKEGDKVKIKNSSICTDLRDVVEALENVGLPLDTPFVIRRCPPPDMSNRVNLSMNISKEFREAFWWNDRGSDDPHYWVKWEGLEFASTIFIGGE